MRSDKPDTNTDPEYHRGLTNDQLKYELEHHLAPGALRHYSADSIQRRVKLIEEILKERDA